MSGGRLDPWLVLAAALAVAIGYFYPESPGVKITVGFIALVLVAGLAYVATGRDRDIR